MTAHQGADRWLAEVDLQQSPSALLVEKLRPISAASSRRSLRSAGSGRSQRSQRSQLSAGRPRVSTPPGDQSKSAEGFGQMFAPSAIDTEGLDRPLSPISPSCRDFARRGSNASRSGTMSPSGKSALKKASQIYSKEKIFGWTTLHHAAAEGDVEAMKKFLAKGDTLATRLTAACNYGNQALHVAARSGHAAAVGLLLSKKSAVEARNDNGWTPLLAAALNGHTDVSVMLVQADSPIRAADNDGITACMWAAKTGNTSLVKTLMAATADPFKKDKAGFNLQDHARFNSRLRSTLSCLESVKHAMHDSLQRGDEDGVRLALQEGAQVDHLDGEGWKPLIWEAACGSLDLLKLLTRQGISPELQCTTGAVHNMSFQDKESVEHLLDEARAASRRLLAGAADNDWDLVRKELLGPVQVDTADPTTLRTGLMWAVRNDSSTGIQMLMDARAGLERRDLVGLTAIYHAVELGHLLAVSALHHYRACVDCRSDEGTTLLHSAVRVDSPTMVQLLLVARSDPEMVEVPAALTAMQAAAQGNHAKALNALHAFQADVTIKDKNGSSVLALGAASGHISVIQVLMTSPIASPPAIIVPGLMGEEHDVFSDTKSSVSSTSRCTSKGSSGASSSAALGMLAKRPASSGAFGKSTRKAQPMPPLKEIPSSPTSPETVGNLLGTLASKESRPKSQGSLRRPVSGTMSPSSVISGDSRSLRSMASSSSAPLVRQHNEDGLARGRVRGTLQGANAADTMLAGPGVASLFALRRQTREDELFALIELAQDRREEIVKNMPPNLGVGALLDLDGNGHTPLSVAARQNFPQVAKVLIERKASLDMLDSQGNTALMIAADCGHQDVVEVLLGAKAAPEQRNRSKQRAFDMASRSDVRALLRRATALRSAGMKPPEPFHLTRGIIASSRPDEEQSEEQFAISTAMPMQRLRVTGLPMHLRPEEMKKYVGRLLRQAGIGQPDHVEVIVHDISGISAGAYLEFSDLQQVRALMHTEKRGLLDDIKVCIAFWGGPAWTEPPTLGKWEVAGLHRLQRLFDAWQRVV